MNETQAKNRRQLIGMLTISLAALGGAYLLYYSAQQGGVWSTTNNGTFVTPPLAVSELNVTQTDGRQLLEGETWWLWVVATEGCFNECADALYQLRQLHVLLNRDAERVRRAVVTSVGNAPAELAEYPKLVHLLTSGERLMNGIYIIDPIGNLVLFYSYADAGKPVLEDLKKLLKLSQIG